jgi:hypothetical protein
VHGSGDPVFSDSKPFFLECTEALHQTLLTQKVTFCVLDETDPLDSAYIGVAELPLAPLASGMRVAHTLPLRVRHPKQPSFSQCMTPSVAGTRWHHGGCALG